MPPCDVDLGDQGRVIPSTFPQIATGSRRPAVAQRPARRHETPHSICVSKLFAVRGRVRQPACAGLFVETVFYGVPGQLHTIAQLQLPQRRLHMVFDGPVAQR